MANVDNDEILNLIHGCLTDFHLLKSARCLQEESGQEFSSTDVSLRHIIETYNSFSKLLSQFSNAPEVKGSAKNKKTKTNTRSNKSNDKETKLKKIEPDVTQEAKNKPKNKKVGKSDTDESEKPKNKKTKKSDTIEPEKNTSIDTIKEKKAPPKKKEPLAPPGEFIFPEMEIPLCHIYDELKQLKGSATNMFSISNTKQSVPENISTSKIKEKSDSSNSESEDSSENVLVKLSNGVVFNVPSVAGNSHKRKAQSPEKEKEVSPKKKKKKKKSEEDDTKDIVDIAEEDNEIPVPSKKKKKHKEKNDDETKQKDVKKTIKDDTSQDEVLTEESSSEKKKKKKKKKKEHEKENLDEKYEERVVEDESSTKDKKKKKKKKKEKESDTEEDMSTTKTEESESQEDFQSPKKKKSKENTPFRRVKDEEVHIHKKLADNSYEAKKGGEGGYGEKANDVLKHTRGKGFRHEKTKKKRGSYIGGSISTEVNSISFNDLEE